MRPFLFMSCFFNNYPFKIISACLRFDYANSKPNITLLETPSLTPVNQRPIPTEDDVSEIVISRPTRKEFRFSRPYFLTAMLGYLATYLVLAVVVVLSKSKFTPMAAGLFTSYLSPTVMTLMIGALASFRQEMKKLWSYREVWYIEPQPTTAEATTVDETRDKIEESSSTI